MKRQRVSRWGVGLVATLALVGLGLLYANATLLASATIPLAYVLYGTFSQLPTTIHLTVSREISSQNPAPGDEITVRLTVENTGTDVLPDVRVIDGVPDELTVTDGTPRTAVSLSPGESTSVTYTVLAKRGTHRFDPPVARFRSLAGGYRETAEIEVHGDRQFDCVNTVENPPLQETTTPHAGSVPTDSGGSGLEFYATREYKHGDPVNRIDWRHVAKTGEFKTVQFREQRASKTVVVLDARPICRVTPEPGYPTGVELSAYIGERLYDALERVGVRASVTATGLDERTTDTDWLADVIGPDGLAWVESSGGGKTRSHAETVFDAVKRVAAEDASPLDLSPPAIQDLQVTTDGHGTTGQYQPGGTQSGTGRRRGQQPSARRTDGGYDQQLSGTPRTDGGDRTERILARLPSNAQILLCTPLLDNWPVSFAQTLSGQGYSLLVVTPNVVQGETTSQRIAATNRRLRRQAIERTGARTVDWVATEPIEHALRRALPQLLADQ